MNKYTDSRFNCVRFKTREVKVGAVGIGGANPIRLQSMTNTKTQDVKASVKQCIELAEAGAELIRLTAQNLEAARALKDISKEFRAAGFSNPLVADIHFLPQTAMEAVEHVEKIRVNPGNFTDKKKGAPVDYTDALYAEELERVREKFTPLVLRCKALGRAIRIGTNHGSLSDRIISRYGDTSFGMVEAAFEFARICRDLNFNDIVFSFKASNTRIMTQTYRLAAKMMAQQDMNYPLHLGVTEAGFGRDARIKSAIGIGGLLFDGLGDTIRVSLTEDPADELPVAKEIAALAARVRSTKPVAQFEEGIDFYSYSRRASQKVEVANVPAGASAPVAVAEILQGGAKPTGKAELSMLRCPDGSLKSADGAFIYKKYSAPAALEADLKTFASAKIAAEISAENAEAFRAVFDAHKDRLFAAPSAPSNGRHAIGEARLLAAKLKAANVSAPLFILCDSSKLSAPELDSDGRLNEASIYIGGLICDGFGDIVCLDIAGDTAEDTTMCFDILQGARARRSKAEYIACPSCGRTLYDIQETAKKIKAYTEHMKGVTIAIMGCVVNGPGEMADADYGYVGGAPGKINLYKARTCVEMNIPQDEAIDRLLKLIENDLGKK